MQVCEAWWSCAELEMFRSSAEGSLQTQESKDRMVDRVCTLIEHAQRAEGQMLPVLKELEDKYPPSDAKSMMLRFRDQLGKKANKKVAHPYFEQLRLACNETFRRGEYEKAISGYSKLLDVVENSSEPELRQHIHVLLSNRSCAHEKQQNYTAAEADARGAISAQPSWLKGHMRLARALIGNRQAVKAKEALKQAHAQLSEADSATLRGLGLEAEAEALLDGAQPQRQEVSALASWPAVLFRDSVVVVGSGGAGECVSIEAALSLTSARPGPCSIIVLPGSYAVRWPTSVQGRTIQIIGEGRVKLTRDDRANHGCVVGGAAGCKIFLENLEIEAVVPGSSMLLHCICAAMGATVQVTKCEMTSSAAACSSEGQGSKVIMCSCKTRGPGAVALALLRGCVEARDCEMHGSTKMAVEVREEGRATLERCTISECKKQACCIWQKGAELCLADCTLEQCGHGGLPSCAAVQVGCGTARVTGCSIVRCRGEGVTVQDEDGSARLELRNCNVFGNASGVCFFGGSGELVNNRLQENAVSGLTINYNLATVAFRDIALTRNVCDDKMAVTAFGCTKSSILERLKWDSNSGVGTLNGITSWFTSRTSLLPELFSIDAATGLEMPVGRDRATDRSQHLPPNTEECRVHFNKDSLVAAQIWMAGACSGDGLLGRSPLGFQTPGPPAANAAAATGAALSSLVKCCISELAPFLGRRAVGRVLYGSLCAPPWRSTGLYTVVADAKGSGVRVGLYNVAAAQGSAWQACFPQGTRGCCSTLFLEPFWFERGRL